MGFPRMAYGNEFSLFGFFNRMLKLAKFWGEKDRTYAKNVCWGKKPKHHVSKCIKTENFRNQWPAFTGNQNSGPVLDVEKQIVKLLLVLCLSASFLFLSCFLSLIFSLLPPFLPTSLPPFLLLSSLLRRIFKTHTHGIIVLGIQYLKQC